jgi:toxin ParE1/3/4
MNPRGPCALTPDADADIDAAVGWLLENADETTAQRFLDRVEETLQQLVLHPETGRERRFSSRRLKGLRSWRVSGFASWLVFYKISRSGILVLRVLHGARDLERIFDP